MKYLGEKDIMTGVMCDDMHAETFGDANDMESDASRSNDTERLVFQVESDESFYGEISFQSAGIGLVDIARECEDEGKCVFCDGVFSVMGHIGHIDAVFFAGNHVDMVESGGTGRDESKYGELFQDILAD